MEEKLFLDWLSQYTDASVCLDAFRSQKTFFRVNTIKRSVESFALKSKIKFEKIPFSSAGFKLTEPSNFEIGKTWEYFLGHIYPQSLSSMLVAPILAPEPKQHVLDVAASPGSKFSHMAMIMENKGILVGNDVRMEKLSALYATINRMNILNCIVTLRDGVNLDWKERFDRVLLDAPCTALGSGESAFDRWEIDHSKRIAAIQKKMLFSAYDALKPGGDLTYSTCTYAKEENEEVVKALLDNVPTAKLLEIPTDFPCERGLSDFGDEFRKVVRIYPQHFESEGFFIAKIRKEVS
ncbi:RsmB/NOP family class I SAM-dependent RNA methyltransferase [Candidatus Micrarchaeota archaeon]|nr:RsmB/NOP family class I SAM-dependent RNA methyltransferase [Candidatus Micrarchaeota archaeon]